MSLSQAFATAFVGCLPQADMAEWLDGDAARHLYAMQPTQARHLDDILMVNWWQTDAQGRNCIHMDHLLGGSSTHCLRFESGIRTPLHTHDCVELLAVVRGRLLESIAGRDEEFQAGEIALIDQRSQHGEYLFAEDAQIVFVNIATAFLDRSLLVRAADPQAQRFVKEVILSRKEVFHFVRFVPKATGGRLPDVLERLMTELRERRPGYVNLSQGLVERLLYLLPVEYQLSLSQSEHEELRRRLFEDVRRYLQQHYASVALSDLCREFHYQEDYFNRLIRRCTGLTYKGLLQDIRLEKAREWLRTTSLPVERIARDVGYANLGYFYRLFLRKYGKTPAACRERSD